MARRGTRTESSSPPEARRKPTDLYGGCTEMCEGVMKQTIADTQRDWSAVSQTGLHLPNRHAI